MNDFDSMTALQADTIANLMAENADLKAQVDDLKAMAGGLRKRIEAYVELDEIATRRDRSLTEEITRLHAQLDVLKDVIKEVM
jgi:cell division protein FtsB